MARELKHQETELNARELQIRFSPAVQDAFRSVAVAARGSEHFDPQIYEIVKEWSNGKPTSVHDFIISMPVIAGEVAAHISATRDKTMTEAWDEVCIQVPENGFTVSQSRQRRR